MGWDLGSKKQRFPADEVFAQVTENSAYLVLGKVLRHAPQVFTERSGNVTAEACLGCHEFADPNLAQGRQDICLLVL